MLGASNAKVADAQNIANKADAAATKAAGELNKAIATAQTAKTTLQNAETDAIEAQSNAEVADIRLARQQKVLDDAEAEATAAKAEFAAYKASKEKENTAKGSS